MIPAGDTDYEQRGVGYARARRTDHRLARRIHDELRSCSSIVNIGAGAGSYEPPDRRVVAVEPAPAMIAQRPLDAAPVVRASAERLPFPTASFDAAMAMVTVHQWPDPDAGLAELRRVSRGPVVLLTFDPEDLTTLWLAEYAPELYEAEYRRYPTMDELRSAFGSGTRIEPLPVPFDCVDGFTEAFYGRPEAFLEPSVRRAQSAWSFVDGADEARSIARLADDLASGRWDERHGHLRQQPEFVGSLRLVVHNPMG